MVCILASDLTYGQTSLGIISILLKFFRFDTFILFLRCLISLITINFKQIRHVNNDDHFENILLIIWFFPYRPCKQCWPYCPFIPYDQVNNISLGVQVDFVNRISKFCEFEISHHIDKRKIAGLKFCMQALS